MKIARCPQNRLWTWVGLHHGRGKSWQHLAQAESTIKTIGRFSQVTPCVFTLRDGVIHTADGAFEVAQHHVDPTGTGCFGRGTTTASVQRGVRVAGVFQPAEAGQPIGVDLAFGCQATDNPVLQRGVVEAALTDWIARRLKPECEAYTDGLACFRRLEDAGHAHTTLDTGGGRAATEAAGARWVNVVLGNLKRAISGVYHAIAQSKYARRYLAEAAYRFNRRFRLPEMLPRLATAMMRCKPCPEPALRMAGNFHG
ncbi:hypothetical protein KOJCDNHJ_02843 [Xanthomonas citri pv. punicae]|nr:hypothetical protein FICKIIDM_03687 [Xanthomonas citri pv. punicae]UIS29430.1 hypothetical protein KOJCDNHJ_02843 [Xanthomonas citri pv. punicae]